LLQNSLSGSLNDNQTYFNRTNNYTQPLSETWIWART